MGNEKKSMRRADSPSLASYSSLLATVVVAMTLAGLASTTGTIWQFLLP
jgi:hypothetical protein